MMKKLTWEEFFAKHSDKNAKPYEFREHYHENVIVTHPKFGKGFISEILSDSKAEVTFKDSRRVLVHNRKDMPGLPLAAEGDGHPSDTKITKNGKLSSKPAGKVKPAKPEAAPKASAPVKPAKPATPAPAARSTKAPLKTAPAAKAAKRTAKPARPVRTSPPRPRAAAKRPAKAAKRGKK
jgi:hypothetical protein